MSSSRRIQALLLLTVLLTAATAEVVVDCCLSTTDKFFPLIRIESYKLQEAGQGCDISATVFITKTEKTVCIVHPTEENKKTKWVQTHIEYLEKKKKKAEKSS
uniref:Eotaxin-like n=2 Tax=Cynoglossus semilaevis TaxID=244447 RepID=A0A3P8WGM0_CYNSE